jgi:threonine dehydrogenase-like Zn-dependent dehydrogenase
MLALTVTPRVPKSIRLVEVSEPLKENGPVLVKTLSVGICGTDFEIVDGKYGEAPPHQRHLILGHEAIGEILEAPSKSPLSPGDLVTGIVRHPDPVPCSNCEVGEWDMCQNGLYTEHGIKGRDGFCSERYRCTPDLLIPVSPKLRRVGALVETTSVLAKAWEHIERIGSRARWKPSKVLITGAGPVGMMAALLGVQRGLEVHVYNRSSNSPKPELVQSLGAYFHTGSLQDICPDADIVIECTGVGQMVFDVMKMVALNGIVCLAGVSSRGRKLEIDFQSLNRTLVLDNNVIFGSVNANRRHYKFAVEALLKADIEWLERVITRRLPISQWQAAFDERPLGDIKTVLDFLL